MKSIDQLRICLIAAKGEKSTVVGSIEGRAPIAVVGDNLLVTDQSGLSISVRDNIQGSFKVKGELKVRWIRKYLLTA